MSKGRHYEIPELYPQPKQITLTGGDSSLSVDIRLGTSNVLPLQRKAIRSILTTAGVKVIANKKQYIVDVRVEDPVSFDMSDVPQDARGEYYEIRIQNSEIVISAPDQTGTTWGAQTLVGIYRHLQRGNVIPNMLIRDWPSMPHRGIFVESKWGPDRMSLQDWYQTIDSIASVKMNMLGIGIYGCWGGCRFEGTSHLTEFLMVPVSGHEELDKQHTLRWFSPAEKEWMESSYKEVSRENDFFGEIVAYGRERGVTVIPFVNSLGHNTFFPRLMPELSAKNADGTPTANGYCLSNPKTRQFIEEFYGSIIERYYPAGIDFFHVQMDEICDTHTSPDDPYKVGSPWCQCPECSKISHDDLLSEYIIWLVRMLTAKGVGKVVIWNDMLTSVMSLMTPEFAARLEAEGLKDRLVLDCWDYANVTLNPRRSPEYARKLNMESWVTPMTCYYDWSHYNYHIPNIDLMMKLGYAEGSTGAIAYSVHNPSHLDHEALLAGYAWENAENADSTDYIARWETAHFNENAKDYDEAMQLLRSISTTNDWGFCWNYNYTYCHEGPWPRPYPGEALDRFEALPEDPVPPLQTKIDQAIKADAIFARLLGGTVSDAEKDCLKSLRAEANRMLYYSKSFAWMLELRKELAATGAVKKSQASTCAKLKGELHDLLAVIEANAPSWLVPAMLTELSPIYAFFGQLEQQLTAFAGRKKANAINWTVVSSEVAELPQA